MENHELTIALRHEVFISKGCRQFLTGWTLFFWGLAAVCAVLFYTGQMDYTSSTKTALYSIVIWLNACAITLLFHSPQRTRAQAYRDFINVWLICYLLTNVLWEIPWLLLSRFVFQDVDTLADVVAKTPQMRSSISQMWYWTVSSFSSVDLRTINENGTFYALELFVPINLIMLGYYFYLNKIGSKYRYLIPVTSASAPVVATLIFSLSEVFDGYRNMPGDLADTMLSLVWTQYQYILFPLMEGYFASKLLFRDWVGDPQLDQPY